MNYVFEFAKDLFRWGGQNNVPLLLARPKFIEDDFKDSDLDIIIDKSNIQKFIQSIKQSYMLTCQYVRHDGMTLHIGVNTEQGVFFFHVDLIDRLEIKGIPYLPVKEVLNRRYQNNEFYYADIVDQFVILVMTHLVKHQDTGKFNKYRDFSKNALKEFSGAIQERLENILGSNQAIAIIDYILSDSPYRFNPVNFMFQSWQNDGLMFFAYLFKWFGKETFIRMTMPHYKIILLGVDGSGKTSLINILKHKLAECYPVIKTCHVLPQWPWGQETDSNQILENPHEKPERGIVTSFLKLLYFFCRYWLIELWPTRKPVLSLYDRYIYDMAVDPRRYRFKSLSSEKLLSPFGFFPKANLCFIIDVPAAIAQSRKKEVPFTETARQVIAYKKMVSTLPNTFVVQNDQNIDDALNIILTTITRHLIESA